MAARKSTGSSSQTQREFIDYRFNQVFDELKEINRKIDGFTFVKQVAFDKHVEEAEKNYVTKDEFRPVRFVVYTVGSAFLISITTAIVAFIVKGGLK